MSAKKSSGMKRIGDMMKSNSEMAARFLGGGLPIGVGRVKAVREFAKWLTAQRKKEPKTPILPALIPVTGGTVYVAEDCGRTEVVLVRDGQSIRLLADQDGIHVGTLHKD
jgi:hypothetical protein